VSVHSDGRRTTPAAPTSGPADWWARPLRPSDAARGVDHWLLERTGGGGKDYLACLAGLAAGALFLLLGPVRELVASLAMLTAWAFGMLRAYPTWRRDGRKAEAVAYVAVPGIVSSVLLGVGWAWAATLVSFGVAEALARRPHAEPGAVPLDDRWYSHNTLRDASVRAGVRFPEGEERLGYIGRMNRDAADREWQTVNFPAPITWRDVVKVHERIARSLDLPAERLVIEHEKGKPEGYVTFVRLPERLAIEGAAVAAVPTDRVDYSQPIPLGHDRLGQPEVLHTANMHTVIVGATGSGKTSLIRWDLAHALMDPRVPIFVINGKDDEGDLKPIEPLCAMYVGGADRNAVAGALDLLKRIEQISEHQGTLPKAERRQVVLIVDELFRIRSAAARFDKVDRTRYAEELDALHAELDATIRSRNISKRLLLQKGTSKYLPTEQSINYMQKVVGMCEGDDEARYVLDRKPPVLPTEPGDFLVKRPGAAEPKLVHVPFVTDEQFLEVIERASRLRADEPHPTLDELCGQAAKAPAPAPAPMADVDPLTEAVRGVLKRQGPLAPSVLYARLPEDIRPGGPGPLGRALRQMPGVREARDSDSRARVWEYLPAARPLPARTAPDEQPVPLHEALATRPPGGQIPARTGSEALPEAATGTSDVVPLHRKALP
jgi:hypothetical protein